jgi:hypothetical protein
VADLISVLTRPALVKIRRIKMEFIREFSIDGYATYLDSYLVDIYLPHRTLIILAVVAITLRSIKLFRERK